MIKANLDKIFIFLMIITVILTICVPQIYWYSCSALLIFLIGWVISFLKIKKM